MNRRASRTGSKFRRALSDGSANQETIGMPLSKIEIDIFEQYDPG